MAEHHRKPRPSPARRGYGPRHRQLREHWTPLVAAGRVQCSAPVCLIEKQTGSRRIARGHEWDLGHDETDRRKYSGPQHMQCNRGQARRSPTKRTPAISPPAPFNPDDWK